MSDLLARNPQFRGDKGEQIAHRGLQGLVPSRPLLLQFLLRRFDLLNAGLGFGQILASATGWTLFSISKPSTKGRLGRYSAYTVCLARCLRADFPTQKRRSSLCHTPRAMQLPVAVNQPLVPVQPFQFHARRGQAVEAYAAVH